MRHQSSTVFSEMDATVREARMLFPYALPCSQQSARGERIRTVDKLEPDERWWFREWSELVAGPRWKNFIRSAIPNRSDHDELSHPAMSVYKGYGWPKRAEDFLSSFGIKNAFFSVNASFVKDDAFCKLIPCPLQTAIRSQDTCTIEFDGASKGNPGKAGAGAILRASDKSVLFYLREGVGIATNNVA